jgi:2-desacetyl-2-hydroxyethyl bacteriochlorophyllide A dehydrogenase
MKAVVFDGKLRVDDVPWPCRAKGDVLVRVSTAGICNTDHEILKGYMPGFSGIPGHEFVGVVEEAGEPELVGRRVTAEINCGCGTCELCRAGMQRHCPDRTVLGIAGRDGAFAEFVCVPAENIVRVPAGINDTHAVFIEPLAAALEVLEQTSIGPEHTVLVIGDGKLGQLLALVMRSTGCRLRVAGRHAEKLALLSDAGIETLRTDRLGEQSYDVVIEASGSPEALQDAVSRVRPRGRLVLKSTYAGGVTVDLAPVVVNELTVIGSRCGRFDAAVAFMQSCPLQLERLVTATYPLDRALEAFERSARPDSLKILLDMG